MRTILWLLLFSLIIQGCIIKKEEICNNFPLESQTLDDELDHIVIKKIVESIYPEYSVVHISQRTMPEVVVESAESAFQYDGIEYDQSLFDSIIERNDTIYFLSNAILTNRIKLISQEELDCLFGEDKNWKNYYEKYPVSEGLFVFTRAGYSEQEERAIIEYCHMKAPDSASFYFVILKKVSEEWIVERQVLIAVA